MTATPCHFGHMSCCNWKENITEGEKVSYMLNQWNRKRKSITHSFRQPLCTVAAARMLLMMSHLPFKRLIWYANITWLQNVSLSSFSRFLIFAVSSFADDIPKRLHSRHSLSATNWCVSLTMLADCAVSYWPGRLGSTIIIASHSIYIRMDDENIITHTDHRRYQLQSSCVSMSFSLASHFITRIHVRLELTIPRMPH